MRYDDLKGIIRHVEELIEIVVLTLLYFVAYLSMNGDHTFSMDNSMSEFLIALIYGLLLYIIFFLCDAFKFGHLKLTYVYISQIVSLFFVNAISYFQLCLIQDAMLSIWPMAALMVLDFLVSFIFVYCYTWLYHRMHVPRKMVMIYGTEKAVSLRFKMNTRSDLYSVNTIINCNVDQEQLQQVILQHDAVVINDVPAIKRNDILKYCHDNGIRTYVVPKISDIIIKNADDITLFDSPLLLIKGKKITLLQRFVKRGFDIVMSFLALVLLSPVMLVIAVAIKLYDGGPVLFKQRRVTENGRVFEMLKFRSMIVDAEKMGVSVPATTRDPRITPVGAVIRATRLDELPQLINIIRGDMSIVGPRPERVEHVEAYTASIPEFSYRQKVRGGLTGYAQIYGKYNTDAYDKLRLDLMYIENFSLLLDLKLILMTIPTMLKKESTEGFDVSEEIKNQVDELFRAADTSDDSSGAA